MNRGYSRRKIRYDTIYCRWIGDILVERYGTIQFIVRPTQHVRTSYPTPWDIKPLNFAFLFHWELLIPIHCYYTTHQGRPRAKPPMMLSSTLKTHNVFPNSSQLVRKHVMRASMMIQRPVESVMMRGRLLSHGVRSSRGCVYVNFCPFYLLFFLISYVFYACCRDKWGK